MIIGCGDNTSYVQRNIIGKNLERIWGIIWYSSLNYYVSSMKNRGHNSVYWLGSTPCSKSFILCEIVAQNWSTLSQFCDRCGIHSFVLNATQSFLLRIPGICSVLLNGLFGVWWWINLGFRERAARQAEPESRRWLPGTALQFTTPKHAVTFWFQCPHSLGCTGSASAQTCTSLPLPSEASPCHRTQVLITPPLPSLVLVQLAHSAWGFFKKRRKKWKKNSKGSCFI